jgi:hypothetical protein
MWEWTVILIPGWLLISQLPVVIAALGHSHSSPGASDVKK